MSQPQPIKITNAVDVLDVLPALLGFYPTESLCVLALNDHPGGGQTLAVTARADLPTDPPSLAQTSRMVAQLLHNYDRLTLVTYSADQEASNTLVRHLLHGVDPTRIVLAMTAGPQGWTPLEPNSPDTVQPTNPYPKGTGPAAAAAAAAGLYVSGTREDVQDSIAAPDTDHIRAFHDAYQAENVATNPNPVQTATLVGEVSTYVEEFVRQPWMITTDDAAYLVARIQHTTVRDAAWILMDRPTGRLHADLWRQVAGLTPDTALVLPVLGLLGMAGWISGEGVLASVALERATGLPAGNRYSMLDLVQQVIGRTLPPTMWDTMREELGEL